MLYRKHKHVKEKHSSPLALNSSAFVHLCPLWSLLPVIIPIMQQNIEMTDWPFWRVVPGCWVERVVVSCNWGLGGCGLLHRFHQEAKRLGLASVFYAATRPRLSHLPERALSSRAVGCPRTEILWAIFALLAVTNTLWELNFPKSPPFCPRQRKRFMHARTPKTSSYPT